MEGKLVKKKSSVATQVFVDISVFEKGNYLLSVLKEGQFIKSTMLVKD